MGRSLRTLRLIQLSKRMHLPPSAHAASLFVGWLPRAYACFCALLVGYLTGLQCGAQAPAPDPFPRPPIAPTPKTGSASPTAISPAPSAARGDGLAAEPGADVPAIEPRAAGADVVQPTEVHSPEVGTSSNIEPVPGAAGPALEPVTGPSGFVPPNTLGLYEDWTRFKVAHAKRIWWLNYLSAIAVTLLVLAIVVFGLVLTWLQFSRAKQSDQQTPHELELGGGSGLKIKSSVVGLLILALSLGFFYLFLEHVFKVEMVPDNLLQVPTRANASPAS